MEEWSSVSVGTSALCGAVWSNGCVCLSVSNLLFYCCCFLSTVCSNRHVSPPVHCQSVEPICTRCSDLISGLSSIEHGHDR